jgi:hypothetical protein
MDEEIVVYINSGVLLHWNNDLWFEGKWMQLGDIMLSKQGSETQKLHVFSHMWMIQR